MDKDLFKSAILKCKQAAENALGTEHWMDEDVTYSSFIKECFHDCKKRGSIREIRKNWKKVADVVTAEEFFQLLRWPSFYRGWNFAQRYLFEEKYGLNSVMHAAMERRCLCLPNYGEMGAKVDVKRLSKSFRLVEIKICSLENELEGCFLLELTNQFCVVLYLTHKSLWCPDTEVSFDVLSPRMMQHLELKTKQVRDVVTRKYFPIYFCHSLEDWVRSLSSDPSTRAERFSWLREICNDKLLPSRAEKNALKMAFGIGDIIWHLDWCPDNVGSMMLKGRKFSWNGGADFRIVRLKLPYDIEIPIFRKNGKLYILRTVSDLKKV